MSDLISRQAAIDAINKAFEHVFAWDGTSLLGDKVLESVPSAQPDITDINDGDIISRQAAIDIERNATVDANPSHFEAHQKFTQYLNDAEISSFGRWQWSNGFNTALTAVVIGLNKLPSLSERIWK